MPSGDVLRCYHHLGHFSWDEQLLQVRAWLDPAGPVLMFSGALACSVGKEKGVLGTEGNRVVIRDAHRGKE